MPRSTFSEMTCSIARTLDVIGDTWSPLVLRDLALGLTRFDTIQRDLGISRKVLAQRLAALAEHGIVDRVPYQERPLRHEYRLTEKGLDLLAVLLAMQSWGDRWVFGRENAPVTIVHAACGERTEILPSCGHCGKRVVPGEVALLPGPGLRAGSGTAEAAAALERLRVGARTAGRVATSE